LLAEGWLLSREGFLSDSKANGGKDQACCWGTAKGIEEGSLDLPIIGLEGPKVGDCELEVGGKDDDVPEENVGELNLIGSSP
jgi:hypothetical protein